MDKRLAFGLAAGAGVIGLIAGLFAVFSSGSPTRAVAIGEPIRQDDFLYTVVGVAKTPMIGTPPQRIVAHGEFYVATIQVDNQAKRVDYRWDPSIVYVVDAGGKHYGPALDAQRTLDTENPDLVISAGSSARYQVVFDLPRTVAHPALAFSNGILMGDVFDFAQYARARVPLD